MKTRRRALSEAAGRKAELEWAHAGSPHGHVREHILGKEAERVREFDAVFKRQRKALSQALRRKSSRPLAAVLERFAPLCRYDRRYYDAIEETLLDATYSRIPAVRRVKERSALRLLSLVSEKAYDAQPAQLAGDLHASLTRRILVRNSSDLHYVEPDTLMLGYSSRCPSRCGHCIMQCSPHDTASLSKRDLRKLFLEAKKLNYVAGGEGAGISRMMLLEGEPFVDPELMAFTLAEARRPYGRRRVNLEPAYIYTNAFWATSERKAREILFDTFTKFNTREVVSRKESPVYFSLDDLHQQYIPLERLKNAILASDKVFPNKVILVNVMDTDSSRGLVRDLRKLLGGAVVSYVGDSGNGATEFTLSSGTRVAFEYAPVLRSGRAKRLSKKYIRWAPLSKQDAVPEVNTPLSRGGSACETVYVNADGRILPHPDHAASNILSWGHLRRGGLSSAIHFGRRDPVTAVLSDKSLGLECLQHTALQVAGRDPGLQNLVPQVSGVFKTTGDEVEFLETLFNSPRLHLAVTQELLDAAPKVFKRTKK